MTVFFIATGVVTVIAIALNIVTQVRAAKKEEDA